MQFRKPRIYFDRYGDRWIDGEGDIGRYRVPPMPVRIVLTDRTDGLPYVLTHTGSPGSLVVAVVPWVITPTGNDATVYGPLAEGPYDNGQLLRLISGVISFANTPVAANNSNGLILTRRGFESTVLQLTSNPGVTTVTYTEITL